jgi:hypothetical protein
MLGDEYIELRWFTVEEACALEALALSHYRDLFKNLALSPDKEPLNTQLPRTFSRREHWDTARPRRVRRRGE